MRGAALHIATEDAPGKPLFTELSEAPKGTKGLVEGRMPGAGSPVRLRLIQEVRAWRFNTTLEEEFRGYSNHPPTPPVELGG